MVIRLSTTLGPPWEYTPAAIDASAFGADETRDADWYCPYGVGKTERREDADMSILCIKQGLTSLPIQLILATTASVTTCNVALRHCDC